MAPYFRRAGDEFCCSAGSDSKANFRNMALGRASGRATLAHPMARAKPFLSQSHRFKCVLWRECIGTRGLLCLKVGRCSVDGGSFPHICVCLTIVVMAANFAMHEGYFYSYYSLSWSPLFDLRFVEKIYELQPMYTILNSRNMRKHWRQVSAR